MQHRLIVIPFLFFALAAAAQTAQLNPAPPLVKDPLHMAAPEKAKPASKHAAIIVAPQHEEQLTSLPVRRVVLYKNGVGFFEHIGKVRGNEDVGIEFTTGQLNDVLKSLTAVDLNGGEVSGIRYNSIAPLSQRLSTLPVQLGEDASREDLLKATRGARVEIKSGTSAFTGRLLAVESVERKVPGASTDDTITVTQLGVLSDSGEMRSFELGAGLSVRFLEPELNRQLSRYLSLVASSRAKDLRQMTLSAIGTGERNLLVSYISEVPVWKSTYRLLIPSKAGQQPLLQGWAIVDNTVGADWKDIELSLVAGEPQSFVQNLSQPLYVRRPEIALPETAQLSPQTHEATVDKKAGAGGGGDVGSGGGAGFGPGSGDRASVLTSSEIQNLSLMGRDVSELVKTLPGYSNSAGGSVGNGYSANVVPEVKVSTSTFSADNALGPVVIQAIGASAIASAQSDATGAKMGDYFEYSLKQRITVLQNQSALVPIVSARVEADKVTLWNPAEPVPLRALWLKNTTGLTLDGGTFNILDGDSFAGEGIFDEMKPDERRLLSYAADTAVRVKTDSKEESLPVTRVRITGNTMYLTRELRNTASYDIHNADTTPRSVVVEYPARPNWKFLPESAKPEETTQNLHRFRVEVEAGKNSELKVAEFLPLQTSYYFSSFSNQVYCDQIFKMIVTLREHNKKLDDALDIFTAKNDALAGTLYKISLNRNEINEISQQQNRLRQNMQALNSSAEEKTLRQRYVTELSKQEDRLAALDAENKKLTAEATSQQDELNKYVATLNFDVAE